MIFYQEREQVLRVAKKLAASKLVTLSAGNVSLRIDGSHIAITPSDILYETMQVNDVVIVDYQGKVVDGELQPSSETPMHCLLLRERPDVGAIIHTHSPYAQAFAVARREIPAIAVESMLVGVIPVAPYCAPGTVELGQTALETLTRYNTKACLLANHGLLAIGNDLAQAYAVAQKSEELAAIYLRALQLGGAYIIG